MTENTACSAPSTTAAIRPVIVGTAGHIDHGKTALVRALTGVDTDRLKEEKARGITIELGFAALDVGPLRFGVVDVPGHERFVKTMVAGATGIDIVMLVIAADEGVKPQTREHLDICELLGVRRGLVVLSKSDAVAAEELERAREQLRARLAGSFLQGAPIVPCSAVTGAGLDAVRAALVALASEVPGKDAGGLARLPLDRVFTMRGFGTVVTGTLAAGRLCEGDDVVVLPGGTVGKVRGLQVHGEPRAEALAGQRVAINLQGAAREAVTRGETLVRPDTLAAVRACDVELRYLALNHKALAPRARLLLHAGTAQVMALVRTHDRAGIAPGGRGFAHVTLATPLVLAPGDHFILRGFAPLEDYGTTMAGGVVVRLPTEQAPLASADMLARMLTAPPDERVALELEVAGTAGATRAELRARSGVLPRAVDDALTRLVAAARVIGYDPERDAFLTATALAELRARAEAEVSAFHAGHPHASGMPREALRQRLPGTPSMRLMQFVLHEWKTVVVDKELVRAATHQQGAVARTADSGLGARLVELYRKAALAPPRVAELSALVAEPAQAVTSVVAGLVREGALVRVSAELLFERDVIAALRARLVALLSRSGEIDAQGWKQLVGQSRKFAIPLAEYFDAEKLTLRVGERRRLRGR
jgi:selenocysteine-specific elongation factor